LKIAIFTDTFVPMVNGVVTAVLNIAKPMADRGHQILIVTPKTGKVEPFNYPGITIWRLSSIPASFYEEFRWTTFFSYPLFKHMKQEGFELVHFMTPFTVSYLGIKIARMLEIPVIGTFHTFISDPSYYEHLFKGIIKTTENTAWKYTNLFYNSADLVTAPSPSTLRAMKESGCVIPGEVISNGIDPELFDNSKWESFKRKYNLGEKVVLYFGRIAEEKNLTVLVDGFEKAWSRDKELQLLLIGDGPQRASLEKRVMSAPMADQVQFTGSIPHDELIRSGVFKACRLFVSASKTENQPMTILEAQVNGMVCLGANARGIPDLVHHGKNGFLFEPEDSNTMADQILQLINDEALYQTFKSKTKEMIQEHMLDRILDRWDRTYSQLIEDYRDGKYAVKDYLHIRSILSIVKDFKLDLSFNTAFFKMKN